MTTAVPSRATMPAHLQHAESTAAMARAARAQRHPGGYSRFVHLMKVVSATVALILLVAVIIWPQLKPRDGSFQLGTSHGGAQDAERLNMINPRYTGLDENNLPYEVTADLASQANSKSEFITLDNPKADMTMKDGTWVALTARSGLYGQKSQQLELNGDVNLFHDSGYEFTSTSATIDLNTGAGEGKEQTSGHGPAGEIEGEGFRFTDKGKTIIFTGKSRLVLYPSTGETGPSGDKKTAEKKK